MITFDSFSDSAQNDGNHLVANNEASTVFEFEIYIFQKVPKMKTGRRSSDITDIYEWLRRRSPSPNKLLVLPGTVFKIEN